MVTFKEGVRFKVWTPALSWILDTLVYIDERIEQDIIVTSVNDGQHMIGSRHYTNEAIDIRTHNLVDKPKVVSLLISAIGAKFTVLLENPDTTNEHIHIQVKKGETFV